MRSLRLGIDLDGVVANFNAGWIGRYNTAFAAELHDDHVLEWDAPLLLTHFECMDDFWAWSQEGTCSIFRDLPPYPQALETLELLGRNHQVIVVSSKYDWAIPDTLEWIAQHRLATRELHFTWEKPEIDCDIYLDDAEHNLSALLERRPDRVVCRMVRPWNRPHAGAIDIHSWSEFAELVATLEQASDRDDLLDQLAARTRARS